MVKIIISTIAVSLLFVGSACSQDSYRHSIKSILTEETKDLKQANLLKSKYQEKDCTKYIEAMQEIIRRSNDRTIKLILISPPEEYITAHKGFIYGVRALNLTYFCILSILETKDTRLSALIWAQSYLANRVFKETGEIIKLKINLEGGEIEDLYRR